MISAAAFTAYTGPAVVCPITARVRPFWTSAVLQPRLPISREILTSHVLSIDTLARPIRYAGSSVGQAVAEEVRAKLESFIAI